MDTQRGANTQSKQQLQARDLISAAVSYTIASPSSALLLPSLLIDLYMPTATCFIFMCVRVCVCVRVGQLGVGVGTGRDGIKGRYNIMIHFLYILLFLIWHMYIIHC